MKRILLAIALVSFTSILWAQETEAPKSQAAIWKSAEEAYSVGDFDGAIREYQSLEKAGAVSSSLFYNLGNAFYRKGSVGKAILYYERALKLDPADKDIRNNLDMARLQTLDKIDSVPQFILVEWVKNLRNKLSSNAWAIVSLILLALGVALLLLCKFGRSISSRRSSAVPADISFPASSSRENGVTTALFANFPFRAKFDMPFTTDDISSGADWTIFPPGHMQKVNA